MDSDARDTTLLYNAVRDLDAETILELLKKQEIRRSASTERATCLMDAHNNKRIQLEEWEHGYLVKVENESEFGSQVLWGVDLAWRRYLAEQKVDEEILASSLNLTSIRNAIRTYFSPSTIPHSDGDDSRIVEFGKMYEEIVDHWEENGRLEDWAEKRNPGIKIEVLRLLTLKVYRDVRKLIARVACIRAKYQVVSSRNSTQSGGAGQSRPPHNNSQDSFPTPAPSSDNRSWSSRSSSRSPKRDQANGNGSSHTLVQESSIRGMSETKKGKRRRVDEEEDERERESTAAIKVREVVETATTEVEADQDRLSDENEEEGVQAMDVDEVQTKLDVPEPSKRKTQSPPNKESATLQPPRPTAAATTEVRRRSPRLRTPSAVDAVQPLSRGTGTTTSPPERDPPQLSPRPETPAQLPSPPQIQVEDQAAPASFEASQFPQPLIKPTYLQQRISRSPSKERSASPYNNQPRKSGLPAGLRQAAEQNQSKLRRFKVRASEAHSEAERSMSAERSVSVEQQEQVAVRKLESVGTSERESREKTEQVEEAPRDDQVKPLTSTPSGILMPPPPLRTSQPDPPSQPSSGETSSHPSPGAEPSTILSSPPIPPYAHPGTISVKPITTTETLAHPSSSWEEGEPSTQKSSQDLFFPTAAQPNTSRPNPHFPPAQDSPATSSAVAPSLPIVQAESQSQSQSQSQFQSQSQPSDSANSSDPRSQPLDRVNNSSSESASTSSYPRILVPDTSNSTNADSHSSSASSSAAAVPPPAPARPRALTPVPPISRASSREPPPSDRKLRSSSSRPSKSPAPTMPIQPKTEPTSVLSKIRRVLGRYKDEDDSQAIQTQAPAPASSYYDAQEEEESQGVPLSTSQVARTGFADDEEDEEEEEDSQDSSGLTYLSHEEKERRDAVHREKLRMEGVEPYREEEEEEDFHSQAAISQTEDAFDPGSSISRVSTVSPEKGAKYLAHRKSFGELENAASGDPSDEEALDLHED